MTAGLLSVLAIDTTLTAKCGCAITRHGTPDPETGLLAGHSEIKHCALHGAAGLLLAACRESINWDEDEDVDEECATPEYQEYRERIRAAISAAEGK